MSSGEFKCNPVCKECPHVAELIVYCSNEAARLTKERIAEIEKHLEICPHCQEQIERTDRAASAELLAQLQVVLQDRA
jgi:hypothetical protein